MAQRWQYTLSGLPVVFETDWGGGLGLCCAEVCLGEKVAENTGSLCGRNVCAAGRLAQRRSGNVLDDDVRFAGTGCVGLKQADRYAEASSE